jgi:hypothetical protein
MDSVDLSFHRAREVRKASRCYEHEAAQPGEREKGRERNGGGTRNAIHLGHVTSRNLVVLMEQEILKHLKF